MRTRAVLPAAVLLLCVAVAAATSEPALFIALSPAHVKLAGAEEMTIELGQQVWMEAGGRRRLENLGDAPLELLRFDFKTGPASSAGQYRPR